MLRHTTFALLSLCACSVASAQYPITPFGNFNRPTVTPSLNCPNGFCGTRPQTCVGGNCATGDCANGHCANGQMICGPNGCYAPGTAPGSVNPYLNRPPLGNSWTPTNGTWRPVAPTNGNYRIQPYPMPGSTYPGYPNIPSAYRNRSLPAVGNSHLYGAPVPGHYNFYPSATGGAVQFEANSGPGVLY